MTNTYQARARLSRPWHLHFNILSPLLPRVLSVILELIPRLYLHHIPFIYAIVQHKLPTHSRQLMRQLTSHHSRELKYIYMFKFNNDQKSGGKKPGTTIRALCLGIAQRNCISI